MNTLAIDLGGTLIKMGVIANNRILDTDTIPAHSSNAFIVNMERVSERILVLLKRNKLNPSMISGIGISIPGIVDVISNKVLSINKKHDEATQFNFNQWAQEIGIPKLVMENDARAALVGEWQYGAGVGCDNIAMITLGTGIGGASLINGKLLYGTHFQAGCLGGHFTINHTGGLCNCGNIGCVESEASSWKLPELIKNHPLYSKSGWVDEHVLDFQNLLNHYRKNDALATEVTQNCLQAWAAGVVNMIHAYDPEKVIIGGGVMSSSDIIIPYIKKHIEKRAWTPWGNVSIHNAKLGNSAALLGINYLISFKNE